MADDSKPAGAVSFRNGVTAKNPFVVAAMTNSQSNADGTLGEDEFAWITRRAQGGYGIIVTCAAHVSVNGQGWVGELGCFSDDHIAGLQRLGNACHEHGSLLVAQIFHGGMRADDSLFEGGRISCKATTYKGRDGEHDVREMTVPEIERVIDDFVAAAGRCLKAGLDGIELHGAHGYILTQFLCPVLNTRADEWGGSLENRARLIRVVTQKIRASVPDSFVVGARLSPEPGRETAGWSMDPDEIIQVSKWLADDGVDFISVSLFGDASTHVASTRAEDADAKLLITEFRAALPEDVKLMVCGGINSASRVNTLLAAGPEFIVQATAAIGNPDFPQLYAKDPESYTSDMPPWTAEHLTTKCAVGPPLLAMLPLFGMVQKEE